MRDLHHNIQYGPDTNKNYSTLKNKQANKQNYHTHRKIEESGSRPKPMCDLSRLTLAY